MEDGLVLAVSLPDSVELTVLILVVMEDGLVQDLIDVIDEYREVLILIVVDNGLVQNQETDEQSINVTS